MVKVIQRIDGKTQKFGFRTLLFEDGAEVEFPENRGSLVYKGNVYDWYGRKATLNGHIEEVLAPCGFDHNIRRDIKVDRFIAKLHKSGDYVYAELLYHAPRKIYDPDYDATKHAVTGGYLNRTPYVDFEVGNFVSDEDLASIGIHRSH